MKKGLFALLAWVIVVLLVVSACKPSGTTPTATTPTTGSAPSLTITSPANGASLPAGDIKVTYNVTNFKIVDKQGQPKVAGEGHVHLYLDIDAPTTPDKPAAPASGTWAHIAATSHTFTNVTPGSHTISVQLINNDHTPLIPLVITKITVTVTGAAATTTPPGTTGAAAPALTINAPANSASLPEGNVIVSINVENFQLVAPGGANEAGKGHVHYYLDAEIPTTPGAPATTAPGTYKPGSGTSMVWENVKAGTHTFGVQLVNSNHTPLVPPVTAKSTITVTGAAATTTPPVSTTPPATTGAAAAPSLTITSPPDGTANAAAGSITVTISVQNFQLVAPGGANEAGKGHVHYYLDAEIPTTPGAPATTAPGTYKPGSGTSMVWEGVTTGTHTFGVQLVNSDHTPLVPPVTAKVTITVSDAGGTPY